MASEHNSNGLITVIVFFGLIFGFSSLTLPKDLEMRTATVAKQPAPTIEIKKETRVKYSSPLDYIGKRIDFDGNGRADCPDIANEHVFDIGGNPPKWVAGGDNTEVFKLPDAKSIITNHAVLMRGLNYIPVNNPKFGDYDLKDIVVTDKGKDGHVAIVIGVSGDSITVVEQDTYKNIPAYKATYATDYFNFLIKIK